MVGITTGDRGNEQTTKTGYNDMMIRKGVERTATRTFLFLIVCCVLQIGLLLVWAVEGTAQGDSEADRGEVSITSTDKVAAFLAPHKNKIFLPSYVTNRLSEADLPALYDALDNEVFARQWNRVLFAICVLEEDEKAFETVKQFVSTPWDWRSGNRHGQDARLVVRGIVNSVANLAMLDSAVSGPFLADIFTRDGAERFLANWDGYDYPEGGRWDLLVEDVMFSAASGLIHTRVPEYNALVENKAREIHAIPKTKRTDAQTSHLLNCCQLLGWRMLFDEMGWDEGIEYTNTLNSESAFSLSNRYTGKYIRYLNDTSEVFP